MTDVAQPQLAAALAAGLATLTEGASVTFTKYVKVVLPLDGFVFWVRSDIASPSAVMAAGRLNSFALGVAPEVTLTQATITVSGSLHYSVSKAQNEDETVATNQVVFTATSEVNDLNGVGPNVAYIARLGAENIPYAFSTRGRYFAQSKLFHYAGDAIMPAMRSQIVDDPQAFDANAVVASTSLPLWLALNTYEPPYPGFVSPVTLYPSFAVPENLPPPYGAVHVLPDSTRALSSAPHLGPRLQHDQQARERVRITLYGLDNDTAQTFLDTVYQYSLDHCFIGMSTVPILHDEKRTQRELGILAMKKTVDVEVNYSQSACRDVARQLIQSITMYYEPFDAVLTH